MGKRVEWLRFVMRHGRKRPRQLLIFLAFEAYYQLCALRGYRPRHILDPSPESMRGMRAGRAHPDDLAAPPALDPGAR